MSKIHLLDQQTANSIAAGEVVERPASVVKELLENSLDANASVVSLEISRGGVGLIRLTDNGHGMAAEDALLAFSRHATSKLTNINDLDDLLTFGFRGEALASIASVAKVTLETRQASDSQGTRIVMEGGQLLENQAAGCPAGTSISVENLFYNVPARYKFLRKDTTEAGHIAQICERIALARPDVSLRLISNGQELLHTPGNNDLLSAVYAVFGGQTAKACLDLAAREESLAIHGYVADPATSRASRDQQFFYVNGRPIRSRVITAALDEAYKTRLMKGRQAVAVLFLEVPTQLVDINVHPQKLEVRFWNDSEIFRLVYHAVRTALGDGAAIAQAEEIIEAPPVTGPEEKQADQPAALPVVYQQPELILKEDLPPIAQMPLAEELPVPSPPEPLKVDRLAEARLIGSLFATYILLELDQSLLLVDQHAAHEKIIFERLVERHRRHLAEGELLVQDLLVPAVIDLGRREMQTALAEEAQLARLGFVITAMGENSIAIRSIPDTGDRRLAPEAALRQALAALQQDVLKADDAIEEFFYQMACKAAIKANDLLDEDQINHLLADLARLDDPYHCPHGRPVIIRQTKYELEKRFRRIV